MENTYRHAPSDEQQPPVYNCGYLETPYAANRPPPSAAHEAPQADHTAPRWASSHGYDGHSYGFMCDFPSSRGAGFGGPRSVPPNGFDPSVPPPPFGCPPPGHFPNTVPPAPVNTYSSRGASTFHTFSQQFRPAHHTPLYEPISGRNQQHDHEDFSESGSPFGCPLFQPRGQEHDQSTAVTPRAEDERSRQKKQDEQWLRRFLQSRDRKIPQSQQQQQQQQPSCVPELRQALYTAAQLLAQLEQSCQTLTSNADNEPVWADSYLMALDVKRELQDKLAVLDSWCSGSWKAKLSRVAKRRARRLRARTVQQMEEQEKEERISEKEAAIDKWRMDQIRRVEEKKKEQELKLAADAVLCEVRKKQADVKRMQDVLRSLEKLRRLRKEAALRKGIVTEQECEKVFSGRLEQLRCVMKRRTAVYSAEEKALMVMLEGEQEEERKREREKRVKKERERLLQRKHRVDAMLFGGKTSQPMSFLLILFCSPSESITPRLNARCMLYYRSGESGMCLWLQWIILTVLLFLRAGSCPTPRQIRPGPLLCTPLTLTETLCLCHYMCCQVVPGFQHSTVGLFRPGTNIRLESSDHKWTALSTGVNAPKTTTFRGGLGHM